MSILVINPNSTKSFTHGLEVALTAGGVPDGISLTFYTAPPEAPAAISDLRTGIQSAQVCYADLCQSGAIDKHDAFLICCCTFVALAARPDLDRPDVLRSRRATVSDHPLTHMIREHLGSSSPNLCTGIFEASISDALMFSRAFGILTTCGDRDMKPGIDRGVSSFLGGGLERYAGCVTTGLGVLELHGPEQARVDTAIKRAAAKLVAAGAEAVILGCAGFAGKEAVIEAGVAEAGLPKVRIIDGAKSGLAFLVGKLLTGSR